MMNRRRLKSALLAGVIYIGALLITYLLFLFVVFVNEAMSTVYALLIWVVLGLIGAMAWSYFDD